jgi:hypothetical protein
MLKKRAQTQGIPIYLQPNKDSFKEENFENMT